MTTLGYSNYSNAVGDSNQQSAINVANQYIGQINQASEISSLFQMTDSAKAIDDAVGLIGLPFKSADWKAGKILDFWALVKYLKLYPLPTTTTTCNTIKNNLAALDTETTNILTLKTLGNTDSNSLTAFANAVITIQQKYNAAYTTANCGTTTTTPTGATIPPTTNPTPTPIVETTSNLLYYIIGGVILAGAAVTFIIIKRKNN